MPLFFVCALAYENIKEGTMLKYIVICHFLGATTEYRAICKVFNRSCSLAHQSFQALNSFAHGATATNIHKELALYSIVMPHIIEINFFL